MNKNKTGHRRNKFAFGVAIVGVSMLGVAPGFAQQKTNHSYTRQHAADEFITGDSLKGTQVVDSQNNQIGTINNVYIDPQSGKITRAGIEFDRGWFDAGKEYSVTWDKLSVKRQGGNLVATLDQSVIDRVRQGKEEDNARSSSDMSNNRKGFDRGSRENREVLGMDANQQENNQQEISSAELSMEGIRKIQQKLNKEGFDAGHVNGQWGENTQMAIKNFQQSKGLQTTGKLDKATLEELGLDADELRTEGRAGSKDNALGEPNPQTNR